MHLRFEATHGIEVAINEHTVWAFGGQALGDTYVGSGEVAERNFASLLKVVKRHSAARQNIRMTALGKRVMPFVDLDGGHIDSVYATEALITSNPNHILQAHPADCGEIAVRAFSPVEDTDVIALIHASRHTVAAGIPTQALDYMAHVYGVEPQDMTAHLGPSARAENYCFAKISDVQHADPAWQPYLSQDEQGMWHVDFHRRTLDSLRTFGIPADNITVHPGDTAAPDSGYFSYCQQQKNGEPFATNGLVFAMRRSESPEGYFDGRPAT